MRGGNNNQYQQMIAAKTNIQNKVLSQLEDQLNLLANQIATNSNNYSNRMDSTNQQTSAMQPTSKSYMKEYKLLQKKMDTYAGIGNILTESDTVVLQKNSQYLIYSILAIGAIIATLKVMSD